MPRARRRSRRTRVRLGDPYSLAEIDAMSVAERQRFARAALKAYKDAGSTTRNPDKLVLLEGDHRSRAVYYFIALQNGNGERLNKIRDRILGFTRFAAQQAYLKRERRALDAEINAVKEQREELKNQDRMGWRLRDKALKAKQTELEGIRFFVNQLVDE